MGGWIWSGRGRIVFIFRRFFFLGLPICFLIRTSFESPFALHNHFSTLSYMFANKSKSFIRLRVSSQARKLIPYFSPRQVHSLVRVFCLPGPGFQCISSALLCSSWWFPASKLKSKASVVRTFVRKR